MASSWSHLTGTVEYRLDLGGGGASPSAGTKRPRPTNKSDANVGKDVSWVHNAGYFFVPDGDANGWSDSATPTSQGSTRRRRDRRGYPIVYPYSCIDTICKAAIAGCRVKITRYDWVNFGNMSIDEEDSDDEHSDDEDDSEMPLASQGTTESSSSFASTSTNSVGPVAYSAKVLEIRRGGVSFAELDGMLVGRKHGSSTKQSVSKEKEVSPPMTLSMFVELETKIRSTSKSKCSGGGSGAQGRSSSERYSLTARIDATSAIIATLPSDPFALVEFVQGRAAR